MCSVIMTWRFERDSMLDFGRVLARFVLGYIRLNVLARFVLGLYLILTTKLLGCRNVMLSTVPHRHALAVPTIPSQICL